MNKKHSFSYADRQKNSTEVAVLESTGDVTMIKSFMDRIVAHQRATYEGSWDVFDESGAQCKGGFLDIAFGKEVEDLHDTGSTTNGKIRTFFERYDLPQSNITSDHFASGD